MKGKTLIFALTFIICGGTSSTPTTTQQESTTTTQQESTTTTQQESTTTTQQESTTTTQQESTTTTFKVNINVCLLYTSPSPRDQCLSRMPSSA